MTTGNGTGPKTCRLGNSVRSWGLNGRTWKIVKWAQVDPNATSGSTKKQFESENQSIVKPIADVGSSGDDKGKGGKYPILPPGFEGTVPDGYIVKQNDTFGVHFAFRPIAKNGGPNEDQAAYAQTLQWYPLVMSAMRSLTLYCSVVDLGRGSDVNLTAH
jgi:hypothetical protein